MQEIVNQLSFSNKRVNIIFYSQPKIKGSNKGSKSTAAYSVKAAFLDIFVPKNLRIFNESVPNINQKPTINNVR